ncbi:hypothetical protein FE392_02730 [Xenorhabdus sp. 12]|uniref:Transposase n=1 Tax=Xenorhabdus santafensis TaxID=2582833 RepID=A0ABU4S5G1_9GAMM|nr:hypothetical protein [Xenorhabdus sp. 12]MDX7986251.1 hypothetical protein [Xenorhabdus sp. 12]
MLFTLADGNNVRGDSGRSFLSSALLQLEIYWFLAVSRFSAVNGRKYIGFSSRFCFPPFSVATILKVLMWYDECLVAIGTVLPDFYVIQNA